MIELGVTTRATGAVADGSAEKVLADATVRAQEDVARATATAVHAELGQVLKHPTGYYSSHVTADLNAAPPRVTDGNVVYGPWLEGVSSANTSSRFKGYATFRRVAQRMQARAGEVAEQAVDDAVRKING